jgi:hypothetical protein
MGQRTFIEYSHDVEISKLFLTSAKIDITIVLLYAITSAITFSLFDWRGRRTTAEQAEKVPIAIGRSTGNASVYHILKCFLTLTGAIAGIQII